MFYSIDAFEGVNINFTFLGQDNIILIAQVCKICVAIFVFISAYGLTLQLKVDKENLKVIVIRRLSKLMVPFIFVYILSLGFCVLKNYEYVLETYGKDWRFFVWCIIDGLGIANVFGTPTLNETWWYMALAISLILFIPIIYWMYKKNGIASLLMPLFLTYFVGVEAKYLNWYFLTILLGIFAADYELFGKCSRKKHRLIKLVIYICLLLITGIIRSKLGFVNIIDGIMALLVVLFSWNIISTIKVIKEVLAYIGKYSFTIFLIHTFVFKYFYKDFIYSFQYPGIILMVLLGVSLLASIIIEKLKELCNIYRISNWVIKSYENMLLKSNNNL